MFPTARNRRRHLTVLVALASGGPALAQTPEEAMRTLYFKLPLAQPEFHWKFADREAFLAGRLALRILRHDLGEDTIVVFEGGRISAGWLPIESQGPGEIYFGFRSTARYRTAPEDSLVIELLVRENLGGSGPELSGFLPAGSYRAVGSYQQLAGYASDLWLSTVATAEGLSPEQLRSMPETQALLARLRETTGPLELVGYVECWRERWPLQRTGQGWMSPEQVSQRAADRQQSEVRLAEMRARIETLAGQSGQPLPPARWSGTTCEPTRAPNAATRVEAGPPTAEPPRTSAAMRPTITRLAQLQEKYFAQNRRYTTDIGALGYAPPMGVMVLMVQGDANGWAAVLTSDRPAWGCALWYGSSLARPLRTPGGVPATQRGTIVCDP